MSDIHKKVQNRIFYVGRYVDGNLGDWLIARELLCFIGGYGQIFCRDPKIKKYNIPSSNFSTFDPIVFWGMLAAQCFISFFDRALRVYLILPPGHVFSSSKSVFLNNSLTSLRCFFIAALSVFGARVCRFGVSVGPLSEARAAIEKIKAKYMFYYSVRDSESMVYAKTIGIHDVEMCPDLSFLAFLPERPFFDVRDLIVFSFRKNILGHSPDSQYEENSIAGLSSKLLRELNPGQSKKARIAYQVSEDGLFSARLRDEMEKLGVPVDFDSSQMDWTNAMLLYSHSNFVVSNRLHVLLMSMMFGAIPIAVVNLRKHRKIVALLLDADLEELVIDVEEVDFAEKIKNIISGKNKIQVKLREFMRNQKLQIISCFDSVFDTRRMLNG